MSCLTSWPLCVSIGLPAETATCLSQPVTPIISDKVLAGSGCESELNCAGGREAEGPAPGEPPPPRAGGHPKPGDHSEVAIPQAVPTPTYHAGVTSLGSQSPPHPRRLALLLSHASERLSPSEPLCYHL